MTLKFSHAALRAAVAAGALVAATAAYADTTVNVSLSGEGGSKMEMKLDKPAVPAGKVTFVVKNDAMTENHEMVVIKLKSKDQALPLDAAKHRIDEKKLKSMGEVADLKPGSQGNLNVTLKPGSYVLLCNIKGHYEAGMWSNLTVE